MTTDKPLERSTLKMTTVDSVVNWQLPLLAILFVAVIFVAIKTVVHRHESRTLFMQLQVLEKERDKLAAQWSRLKLEQGTMLNQVRVERSARLDLGMKMPKTSEIKTIRESTREVVVSAGLSKGLNPAVPVVHGISKLALGNVK